MKTLTQMRSLPTLLTSTLIGSVALSVPAQAFTFSSVGAELFFQNFSHPAWETQTIAVTDTLAISMGGQVFAGSDAEAVFFSGLSPNTETEAFNTLSSFAFGDGGNYFGRASSKSSIWGSFNIGANETFSFDFMGSLFLATGIETASYESAFALGFLEFSVFGTPSANPSVPNLLDDFELFAALDTPGHQDAFDTNLFDLLLKNNSSNIVINSLNFNRSKSGLEKFLSIDFSGHYRRTFDEPTQVTLVDHKIGVVEVQQVPTPGLLGGLLTFGWANLVGKLRKRLAAD